RTAADRLRGAARRLAIHIDRNQPRPASAIARAIASPMPDPAPVTSAILPSSNPATGYRLRWELDTGEGRYPWRKWVPAFAGTTGCRVRIDPSVRLAPCGQTRVLALRLLLHAQGAAL